MNRVCTGIYATKQNAWLCMMLRFEPRTSCILSSTSYHYAMSVNTLVILVVCTRYIYTVLDTRDVLYLLAGDGRQARVPQRPPLLP